MGAITSRSFRSSKGSSLTISHCFFAAEELTFLTGKARTLQYGFVDAANRCLVFEGSRQDGAWYGRCQNPYSAFSLKAYLDMLFEIRQVRVMDDPEAADLILVMGKPSSDREISLIDKNFFL